MNNTKTQNQGKAQGALPSDISTPNLREAVPPSVDEIEKWLIRDVSTANTLLHALLTDKELRLHLATFMQGRYSNHLNRPDQKPE